MSSLLRYRSPWRDHINVPCACGKTLRAKSDQVGTEILCWNCKATVEVPVPKAPVGWVAQVLRRGARDVLEARTFTLLVLGSFLVTAALLIPGNGCWTAAVALTVVGLGYGELVRRGSSPDWSNRPRISLWAWLWRIGLCGFSAFTMVSPWMLAQGYYATGSPRITRVGVSLALLAASALPLLMLATFAKDVRGRGARQLVLSTIARHPIALLGALAIVPLSLIALEGILYATTRYQGIFAFLVLDLFPKPDTVHPFYGIPYFGWSHYTHFPESVYIGMYADRLRQGYSFVTALPASLAIQTKNGFDPFAVLMSDLKYLGVRVFFTFVVVMSVLAVMAIQARWLGLLSSMDSRRGIGQGRGRGS
jgi:hypothetical protein